VSIIAEKLNLLMRFWQKIKNMIVAFPYHDPNGKFNELIKKSLAKLQTIFSHICISATSSTIEKNGEFIKFLEHEGCLIYKNAVKSNIGDHYRNALTRALTVKDDDKIFFGFVDRVLFALNTDFAEKFVVDMKDDFNDLVLFERTEAAYQTHPRNYREIEQTVNKLGSYLIGEERELATCGFLIKSELARKILTQSTADSYSAGAEWLLLAYSFGIKPTIKKVDWLSWEDPFIDNMPAEKLKADRENQKDEYIKRLEMNLPFINLLVEKRFHDLLK
jgi:hypothetical protein